MKTTFIIIVGTGKEQHSMYYDDYGNAAECALAYRQMGFEVKIEEMYEDERTLLENSQV
jgi:hypothetical protein